MPKHRIETSAPFAKAMGLPGLIVPHDMMVNLTMGNSVDVFSEVRSRNITRSSQHNRYRWACSDMQTSPRARKLYLPHSRRLRQHSDQSSDRHKSMHLTRDW